MASSESSKFFTEDWTITIPTHPKLRFIRLIPTRYNHLVRIFSNPLNDPHNPASIAANWKESDTHDLIKTYTRRYTSAKTAHNALALLVEEKGTIVGIGLMHELKYEPGVANIGTILEEEARGHGVGKVLMELLLRLSNDLDVDAVEVATMKGNSAMRGLMRSLGVEETDKERIVPGDRKVAEVIFKDVDRKRWKDFEFEVEFLGRVDD
ncbi:2fea7afe-b7bb-430c-b95b-96d077a3a01f [Sclerotinia trifoliorum]|uniref:2fea7afe-b7bb-430c-b95b-96d077a3a01f n=1 Tax=Sclerotinia trifoliorum TaxID=28548 RepID=A0A8H2W0H9_9HELO|nr:2fea7afe-b7bb-430c-b95b-96d077a3a01f [Sclerotinia trifoliorum]